MPITIYSEPADQGVNLGETAIFSVGAESNTELKFHWSWNNGDGWQPIDDTHPNPAFSDFKTESLKVKTGTGFGHAPLFHCVLTDWGGDPAVPTRDASLTVTATEAVDYDKEKILVAPQTVTGAYKTGGGTRGSCPGPYSGVVSYTAPNTTKKWFTAPPNTTKITATDKSGFYSTRVEIIELQRMAVSCGFQGATFAKPTVGYQYAFNVYFGTGSGVDGPPDGTQISLLIEWT